MAAIQDRKENIAAMTQQLEEHTTNYGALEEQANDYQSQINQQLYEKQRQAELQQKRHRMLKRYQALERGQRQPREGGRRGQQGCKEGLQRCRARARTPGWAA